jgi:hypothetical protein
VAARRQSTDQRREQGGPEHAPFTFQLSTGACAAYTFSFSQTRAYHCAGTDDHLDVALLVQVTWLQLHVQGL